jgi:chromate transporter
VAGTFFVIPFIFVLLVLSYLAAAHSDVPAIRGFLYGVQPVVIAIVVEAVLRIGKRALGHPLLVALAVASFVLTYFLHLPFPLVVIGAAVIGVITHRFVPGASSSGGHPADEETDTVTGERPSMLRNLRLFGTFLLLWAVPVGALWIWRGGEDVLVREALFFTGAAFVTFGGAYAVLGYIASVAVNDYGWLGADQMVQGLALAESTPGPLIMVTQYVGFLGAWKFSGPVDPLLYGVLGALTTTYVTFLPCFLFIFLLAPYIERLANNRRLHAALAGVTAAVVGVIANLAVFFASRVLFPHGFSIGGLDLFALIVAAASFVILQRYKVPIYLMVPAGAVIGMAWTLL